jgi:hypothetical protein
MADIFLPSISLIPFVSIPCRIASHSSPQNTVGEFSVHAQHPGKLYVQ